MIIGSIHHSSLFSMAEAARKDETIPGFKNFPAIKRQSPRYEPSRAAVQVHMTLDAHIDFETNALRGTCYLVLKAVSDTSSLLIDSKELRIASVSGAPVAGEKTWDNIESAKCAPLAYSYSDDVLQIKLSKSLKRGEHFVTKIEYSVENPKAGIYFVHKKQASDASYDCVWTQGQDVDSPYWFPCQDDPRLKMTTTTRFHFPASWHAIGNGVMTEEKVSGNTKAQTWKMSRAHAPYLVAFAAGDMEFSEDTWRGKPVTLLLPKEFAGHKTVLMKETKDMLEFYSNYWGYEYAWEKYGQAFVADFLYGGMENTSITINTDLVLGPKEFDAGSERRTYLVMHEMAHQWFGDNLTCESWSEGWLNEGFATHSELLWDEHVNGKVSGIFYSQTHDKGWYLEEAKSYWRPVVTNQYEFVSEIFDGHLYSKGSIILNHLRDLIGEESFRASVGHYLKKHEFSPVRTADLMRAIEDVTGWNPRKFFDTYIYRGGHIELEASVRESSLREACIEIDLEQKQTINKEFPPFDFETFVHIQYEDGTNEEVRIGSCEAKQTVFVPLKGKLSFAIVDPRGTIVGDCKQKFSEKFAQAILKSSANGYHKFLAAKSILASNATAENEKLIVEWLKTEPCVRARAAAYEMVAASNAFGAESLLRALDEKEPKAKGAYVSALAKCASVENAAALSQDFEKLATSKSEALNVREQALSGIRELASRAPSLRKDDKRSQLVAFAKSLLKEGSYSGIVEAAALGIVAELGSEKELETYVATLEAPTTPWRIQVGAITALGKYSAKYPLLRAEIRPHLLRYAAKFFPVRLAAQLPTAWAESRDPIYGEAFETFINRKNYGLLSMLIPRARRTLDRFNKNLEPSAVGEKFSELSELKQKLSKLENDFEELKKVLSKKDEK